MEIRKQENLKQYTTVRIGGVADKFYIPENREELIGLLNELKGEDVRILSGGSNLLINDEQTFPHVIYMKKCSQELIDRGDGNFYCGSSVRLQQLIQFANSEGYGGIEYLMSVPGMIGGAVVMNAGTGKKCNQALSDFIVEVEVWDKGNVRTLSKEECRFSHRNSVFKNSDMVILSAIFQFPQEEKEILEQRRKNRLEYSRLRQDQEGFNFGSVFSKCNKLAMKLIKKFQLCHSGAVGFSTKTSNWLVNRGDGTFQQAVKVIKQAIRINRLCGTKAEIEVIIWK